MLSEERNVKCGIENGSVKILWESGKWWYPNYSLISKKLKQDAADYVRQQNLPKSMEKNDDVEVNVDIISADSASSVKINMNDEKKSVTLADILHRHGAIEATCKGSLSCSTCVGVVTTNHEIEGKTEDEEDVVDMVNHANLDQLRVTCCLQLKGGTSYKFASI